MTRLSSLASFVVRDVMEASRKTAAYGTRAVLRPTRRNRMLDDLPTAFLTPWLLASVYGENLLMSALPSVLAPNDSARLGEISDEVDTTIATLRSRGWLDDPSGFHARPTEVVDFDLTPTRYPNVQHLTFASEYVPGDGAAHGDVRWDAEPNRTVHAWVMNHDDGPRPWLVIQHGYAVGHLIDFVLMGAPHWFHDLGFNVIAPVAPYHQQRRVLARSGMGMTSHDYVRNLHAYGQATLDLRRCIGWARTQGMTSCSVYGISMGGYLAALVAGLEESIDTVIAGIPAVDMAEAVRRRCPPDQWKQLDAHGLFDERLEQVHRPVRPLALSPLVAKQRRFIYAGVADQITGARDAHALWQHWEQPTALWHTGTHITTTLSRRVRSFVDDALAPHAVRR